jgi:thiamine pyrophosphate-dependent acetolactate synthase large subunit-like protein
MFGDRSLPITMRGDGVLICGTYMLPEVFPVLGDIFRSDACIVHVDLNAYEIAKNHRVDIGMVADPKLTLDGPRRSARADDDERPEGGRGGPARSACERSGNASARLSWRTTGGCATRCRSTCRASWRSSPAQLPADAIIFDEALTNSPPIPRYRPPARTGEYFLTRGGSLGVGIPGAIGVKLAHPDRTVVGFTGDGGAMYTPQALWTAARHQVDAKFVVCNNGSYRLLQLNIEEYWRERGLPRHDYPLCFDLSYPSIRFDELARSMGVDAVRVEKPWEIAPAIRQALAHPGPFLIDLVLEGDTHPERVGPTCGQ